MNTFRARGLKAATFVVAMLAAIGSWEVYKGIVRPVPKAEAWQVFDHFKCYTITNLTRSYTLPIKVMLQNQFGTETAVITEEALLCAPTAKEVLPGGID
jgi:hypothetical protein